MKRFFLSLFFLGTVMLIGCGKEKPADNLENVKAVNDEITNVEKENNNSNVDITAIIPEWFEPYAEIEQYPETIYLNEVNNSFMIQDDKLLFPETNIIIVSKCIAGGSKEGITDNKDLIMELVELIKDEKKLTESETINPEANLINLEFNMVFLTVDGKYALMEYDLFDDNRIFIEISVEENDLPISFWIKSEKIAEVIKLLCEYEQYDLSLCEKFEEVEIHDKQNRIYKLTEEELTKFKTMLYGLNTKTNMCSGPFDITIIGCHQDQKVSLKWCNDECGILAIGGDCYLLKEEESKWINDLVGRMNK